MKKIVVTIVILSILYFIVGFISMSFGLLQKDTYLTFSAIIGSIASVCGLLSFGIVKKITNEDFENVEIGYLKKVSEAADELKQKKEELVSKSQALSDAEKEIKKLEIKKQEMEFLVKKASLSLFLQDQIERNQKSVAEKIESDPELKRLLAEISPLKQKLSNLEQEIKSDPNVDLLEEIISSEKEDYKDIFELRPSIFGIGININQLARTITRIMSS